MSRVKGLQERLDALKREEQKLLRLRDLLGRNYTALLLEQEQLMTLLDDKGSVQAGEIHTDGSSSTAAAAPLEDTTLMGAAVAKEEDPLSPQEATFAAGADMLEDEHSDRSILEISAESIDGKLPS